MDAKLAVTAEIVVEAWRTAESRYSKERFGADSEQRALERARALHDDGWFVEAWRVPLDRRRVEDAERLFSSELEIVE